jgi:isocitrate lyase
MGLHEDEDRKYAEDVQAVKNWWSDSRWRFTKRPFTAEQIVAKRGTLTVDYPSAVQAKKLWSTLENNWQVSYTILHIG